MVVDMAQAVQPIFAVNSGSNTYRPDHRACRMAIIVDVVHL